MNRLIGTELSTGEFYDLDETIKHFEAVTLADIQALAADLLGRERSIVAVGDVEEKTFERFI